jgi:poly(A)-specific ribonuclease
MVVGQTNRGFNAFQKRLVHQLVRAEFPDLVTITQPGYIQIRQFNREQEEQIIKAKMQAFNEKVQRQIGLRYLIEGMIGGDLQGIDPVVLVRPMHNGRPIWIDRRKVTDDFYQLRQKVLKNRPVLVGHNIFVDLVNFYKCFIGTLPEKVEDFQREIHHLFPLVVDTKYLATHFNNTGDVRSALEDLDGDLSSMPVPQIGKYESSKLLQLLTVIRMSCSPSTISE